MGSEVAIEVCRSLVLVFSSVGRRPRRHNAVGAFCIGVLIHGGEGDGFFPESFLGRL